LTIEKHRQSPRKMISFKNSRAGAALREICFAVDSQRSPCHSVAHESRENAEHTFRSVAFACTATLFRGLASMARPFEQRNLG
jgi:hypothetical protein